MTARWSGAARRDHRLEKPSRDSGPEVERRRVSHGARRKVSGDGDCTSARDVNVGCRSGFEASWRCVQGKAARPHEAQSRAADKAADLDEIRGSLSPQKGCYGQAKAERPEQVPWW
jgi:hypothetical protein